MRYAPAIDRNRSAASPAREQLPQSREAQESPFPDIPRKHVMELRLKNFRQLFNSFDPSPFIEKDLDQEAEDFLVSWAREISRKQKFGLLVHLEECDSETDVNEVVTSAIHNFFEYRADLKRQDMREFFRQANTSLIIGLLVLSTFFLIGLQIERSAGDQAFSVLVRESLLIGGWVAMWRPLEMFLYEWWPIRRMIRLFRRLAEMPIKVAVSVQSGAR